METAYGVFVEERGDKERLVWDAGERGHYGRRFFFGGTSIQALIFSTSQRAHSFARRNNVLTDFNDGVLYVRRVEIFAPKIETQHD